MDKCCKDLESYLDSNEIHLNYSSRLREYSITYKGEYGGGVQTINFCPWCGQKLPESLRNLWFDTLLSLGFDDPFIQEGIPDEFQTDIWWKKRKL